MPLQRLEGPSLGNVTANTLTTTASVNAATFYAGANVSLNTSAVFVGNSTVNTVITSSSITGAVSGVVASPTGFATTLVAGESLAALDAVYVEPTLTGGTAGRVYKMDADVLIKSSQAFFAGFALASASAAANVNVQQSGVVSGFTGLTTGAMYYAGSTAGAITATKPLHPLPVGIAISTTQLLINTGRKREDEQSENVSAVYGYQLGGYTGAYLATADRITFSTGAYAASTVNNLSEARFSLSGPSDASVYGYTNGGYNSSVVVATCDRTTFATSVTTAYAVGALTAARYNHYSLSDGAVYGYVLGGYNSAFTVLSSVERRTFSTGISAAISATLSTARTGRLAQGLSDGATYGYTMGGSTSGGVAGGVSTSDRITFSTATIAASTISNLSVARSDIATVSDGATYGYTCGGYNTSIVPVTTGDRTTFSTGATAALTSANLSSARALLAGVSDGNVYGYISGGDTGGGNHVTTTDRITFSTSVLAAATASNLPAARGISNTLSDGAV